MERSEIRGCCVAYEKPGLRCAPSGLRLPIVRYVFSRESRFLDSLERRLINSSKASGAVSSLGASTLVSHVSNFDAAENIIKPTLRRAASRSSINYFLRRL